MFFFFIKTVRRNRASAGAARGSGARPRPHLGVGETRSEGLALRPAVVNRPGRVYTAGAARRRSGRRSGGRSACAAGGRDARARARTRGPIRRPDLSERPARGPV